MKVYLAIIFLFSIFSIINMSGHYRQKRSVILGLNVLSETTSRLKDAYSDARISDAGDVAITVIKAVPIVGDIVDIFTSEPDNSLELKMKLTTINSNLESIQMSIKNVEHKLEDIILEITWSILENQIATAKTKISSCHINLMNLLAKPDLQAEQDRVKECSKIIDYVRQIGNFLKNEKMTINGKGIFDQVIDQAKGCNGEKIDKVFQYVLGMYIEGCMAVVSAEILIYGNESTSFQSECETNLQLAKRKRNEIYNKCALQSCSIVFTGVEQILNEASGSTIIANLRLVYPWFKFLVILVKGGGDDEININHGDYLAFKSKGRITRVVMWTSLATSSSPQNTAYITFKSASVGFIVNDIGLVQETKGQYTSLLGTRQTKTFCTKSKDTDKNEGGLVSEITKEETVTLPRWGYGLIVVGVVILILPGIIYFIYIQRRNRF